MIVKILSASASFDGVRYNTNKIDRNKGELMKVSCFGPLQGLGVLRPEDYVNYLKMVSAQNRAVSKPQFHAVISAKGKDFDKDGLTAVAEQWLTAMGYEKQPYLIVFHKDTSNNHVHLVSTRIDKQGKKISSAFEKNRAIQHLNRIVGLDESQVVQTDIALAMSYQFATKAQFMMILESSGYILREKGDMLEVIKFGKKQQEIRMAAIMERAKLNPDDGGRRTQLKALFVKYGRIYDPALQQETVTLLGGSLKKDTGYTSELAVYLKETFGIQLIFHSKNGKLPYGYTIIDHAKKTVWKGSEIIGLPALLRLGGQRRSDPVPEQKVVALITDPHIIAYYAALLKAALYNYPDFGQGLHHQGLKIHEQDREYVLIDPAAAKAVPVTALLTAIEMADFEEAQQSAGTKPENYIAPVSISLDIDDEAINGRNRRRKKKARTNSR